MSLMRFSFCPQDKNFIDNIVELSAEKATVTVITLSSSFYGVTIRDMPRNESVFLDDPKSGNSHKVQLSEIHSVSVGGVVQKASIEKERGS